MNPVVVNVGGGVNSTALLVGLHERGVRPDLVVFADTGSEHPHTYQHLWRLADWLLRVGFPSLHVVHRGGQYESIESECLALRTLPSLAFGKRGCSAKWKRHPVDNFVKGIYRKHIDAGVRVRRMLGIDWGELGRAKFQAEGPWQWEYPLIDWRWDRAECERAIARAGLKVPRKSACWMCPAAKQREVERLADEYPELADRAIAIEHGANLRSIKGLGSRWAWADVIDGHRRQLPLFVDDSHNDTSCDCYDGGSYDEQAGGDHA